MYPNGIQLPMVNSHMVVRGWSYSVPTKVPRGVHQHDNLPFAYVGVSVVFGAAAGRGGFGCWILSAGMLGICMSCNKWM